jgi:hypothetical protein
MNVILSLIQSKISQNSRFDSKFSVDRSSKFGIKNLPSELI